MSSFGEEIRRERELREITLREIAESTKISLRYLDALEQNDFEHLPGGVFNKGFVRAFAEHIGVDPEAMVNAYLLEEQSQVDRRGNGPDPRVMRGGNIDTLDAQPAPGKRRLVAGIVATVLILALMIVGFIAVRAWLGDEPAGGTATPPPAMGDNP